MLLFLIGPLEVETVEVVDDVVTFTMFSEDLLTLLPISTEAWSDDDGDVDEDADICCADDVSDSEGGAPIRKDDDDGMGEERVDWLGLLRQNKWKRFIIIA